MLPSVCVVPIRGRQDLHRFLTLPWRIYQGNPAWVAPLLFDLKKLLDPHNHPFHRHAEVQYFLAQRGEEVLGRVAAIVNYQHVQFHDDATGFFGFFESVDDRRVAGELLTAAERWVAERGMQRMRGPMSFSTNEECGLLVDGFQYPPAVMMPYNLPYASRLVESAGYAKAKDLLAYLLDDTIPPARLVHGVQRLQQLQNVTIRPINLRRFRQEVELIFEVYNSAWERNWGFVPMTKAEVDGLARQLRWVGNPNLWYQRKINAARVLTLGLKPGFRRMGIDAMLYLRLWEEAPKNGYPIVECSWILEDNWAMRRGLERMGARLYKTYRIYEKTL